MPQKPTPPTESRTSNDASATEKLEPCTVTHPIYFDSGTRLTIRDSFALAALQGWLASTPAGISHPATNGEAGRLAATSYAIADAMLDERAKEIETPA